MPPNSASLPRVGAMRLENHVFNDPGFLDRGEREVGGRGEGRGKERLPLYDFLSICPTFLRDFVREVSSNHYLEC